jgi:hypothetical protein
MPVSNYRVYGWGPPVGIGITGAQNVIIAGIAKKSSAQDPYAIANEIICSAIARQLLLPCPPGAMLDKSGEPYFFSLNFNLAGQALPPVDPVVIATQNPRLAWGIILFDSLVMNFDRHKGNIAHDTGTNRIQIFDHERAFLHAGQLDITTTFANAYGKLCIGDHCL